MASNLYHRSLKKIMDRTINLASDTLKVMLVGTGYTPNKDHEFVSDVVANEVAGTGYAGGYAGSGRKTLTSKVITYSDSEDKAYMDADDLTWAGISAGTLAKAIVFDERGSDAASEIIACIDIVDYATDLGNYTLQFDAAIGVFYWAS